MKSTIAIPAVLGMAAAQYQGGFYSGEADSIQARDVYDAGFLDEVMLRRGVEDLSYDELAYLQARDPLFGALIKGAVKGITKLAGHRGQSQQQQQQQRRSLEVREAEFDNEFELDARDIEELAARDPLFGALIKGAVKGITKLAGHKSHQQQQQQRRSLEVRDPEIWADDFELDARDLEELAARDPKFGKVLGKIAKGAMGLFLRDVDEPELSVRDIEELAARDPKFGKFLGKLAKGAMGLILRDVEDTDQLSARDVEEIVARDPKFGKFLGKIAKGAMGLILRDVEDFEY